MSAVGVAQGGRWDLPSELWEGAFPCLTGQSLLSVSGPWKLQGFEASSREVRGKWDFQWGQGPLRAETRVHCPTDPKQRRGGGCRGHCLRALGSAYVLRGRRRRTVPVDSCPTAACRCTWWIYRSGRTEQSRGRSGLGREGQAGMGAFSMGALPF